ncbi:WD repeat and HMG-box DNA-binding protein 1 isoform X2 [Cyclopterus lumpus]|uniref:WD repeat and HMG-box DNA-binding protein 1 isoform X2 n=1 Tax=Cyclopterus lumpus TaxID=8103 RepID=UPI001486133D|nr:WD repeat and HMG-box DNA-binding protein 1 isoform X2 [Cyclopterus lumpus]
MPCDRKPMRYGHSEGHTEVCFDESGKFLVTGGNDGDVRIWDGLDDDDPKFITVGEKVYSLALKNGKLVTASSNNTVQIHTFPDGEPDGILTRFTTNATHVAFNGSGSRVAAGSSDFMVKVVEVSDSSQQKTLRGHEAPVLSVTFDPKDDFLASASCDGSVVVWNIEEQSQLIRWPLLQKTNDVSNAPSLCRLAWQPAAAEFLAVPVETKVHLYERGSWNHVSTLSDDLLTQLVNVVVWSPCGRFLAAGGVGGSLTVWDVSSKLCVERQKHEKGFTVCGLAWSPSGSQLAYTDTEGCLGLLDGLGSSGSSSGTTRAKKAAKDFDDLFDDDDDRPMDEGLSDGHSPGKKPHEDDEDEDDFHVPATGRARNRGAILDDENSLDAGSVTLSRDKYDVADGGAVLPAAAAPAPPLRPAYEGPLPTAPQKAFQPGSTPAHLTHRFMMWNSVGIIRGYNDEEDNAVDVEFHDTAVHHAMHLTNSLGHTMADLSQEAVLLACPGTDELASKLQCLHFSSWDTNKEWMVDLPPGEDVRALCLGRRWAAVATSALMLRLFSIGGVQREMFSLPGNVVSMVTHGEQLLIVYHRGTPCYVDSDGVVRMLNRSLGNTWTPVCNTRETCKSKSDHYWVVGIHENPQQLRCIPCKGSRYPPTLPRPAVAILPFKLPLCQTSTEKGLMEEQYWRSVLFHNHFSFLSSSGYEVDEEQQTRSQKEQQELLMKMFALSCKLEREFRCVELAELMTQNVVTLAVRYAARSRRMALAQRLSELALEKANQMQEEEPEEEEEEPESSAGRRPSGSEVTGRRHSNRRHQEEEEEEEEPVEELREEEEDEREEEETSKCSAGGNPFVKETGSPGTPSVTPIGKVGRANPFKVLGSGKPSSSPAHRATSILDNMASGRKSSPLAGSVGKPNKGPVLKPLAPRPKTKTQSTLLQMTSLKKKTTREVSQPAAEQQKQPEAPPPAPPPASPADNAENTRPKTGFQLWLEENRKSISADQPDLEETDVIKEAMGRFRTLTAEERLSWTERAKGQTGDDLKKRKRGGGDGGGGDGGGGDGQAEADENSAKKKKSLDPSAKLSAFAFNKN